MSNFATLLSVADDAPGCGTRWPGWRPNPFSGHKVVPTPAPPMDTPDAFYAMHTAIRIAQSGNAIGGRVGEQMNTLAGQIFSDDCGTMQIRDLLWWLLHHPPPPPPYYLQEMLEAGYMITTGRLAGGEFGRGLEQAGMAQVSRSLDLANTAMKEAANISG